MTVGQRPLDIHRGDPVAGAWCDDDRALSDALGVLRVPSTDPDFARLQICVATACELITAFMDRADDDPVTGDPSALRTAHYMVAVELYRRKDAPFGVLNAWSPDEGQLRITNDPMRGVYHIVLPFKRGFGVAG